MSEQRRAEARSTLFWVVAGAVAAALVFGVWFALSNLIADPSPAEALETPRFVEEALDAGVRHVYDGDYEFFVGGGVAAFDCDSDLDPDLYVAGGENPAGLYRNESHTGGELRFSRIQDGTTDLLGVTGAYPLDLDADGTFDLAVLRLGENQLLRGLGDCRFEPANDVFGFDGGNEWTIGFSARWDHGASLPTMAFGNYVALDEADERDFACSDNVLFRPASQGYRSPEPLTPSWCSLSILFSDWDRSGTADLRVSNDRHYYPRTEGEEQLWRIADNGQPRLYTREEGWKKVQIWGMGIATHDLTGDGLPEVFLTSQGDNKLQTLADGPGLPAYEDIAIRRGVTAHRPFDGSDILPSTAWHPEFEDLNNDGFIDLYISKGNVEAQSDHAAHDPNNLLLGQPDGSFIEAADTAGVMNGSRTRGAALVDLNLDGLLDLVEVNRGRNVTIWRNIGLDRGDPSSGMGNWVAARLNQQSPNINAIGSWLEVRVGDLTITRELTVGGGHAGGQLGWIHFGVGHADEIELRVLWPDGETGPWMTVQANGFAIIDRDKTEPTMWTPPQG